MKILIIITVSLLSSLAFAYRPLSKSVKSPELLLSIMYSDIFNQAISTNKLVTPAEALTTTTLVWGLFFIICAQFSIAAKLATLVPPNLATFKLLITDSDTGLTTLGTNAGDIKIAVFGYN